MRLVTAVLLLCCWSEARAFCPAQCTCVFHSRSDATRSRTVMCNDPDMTEIPVNVPVDTVKLRVERTAVRRVPPEAFYYLSELQYLWITYNAVSSLDSTSFYNLKLLHELRLDGNRISSFPWGALRETPRLRTLDLHNNLLNNVPAEAAPLLRNITYLDLSSNKLTTLPSDLLDLWTPFSTALTTENNNQKIVLGLQDNLWYCDCRISKLIELSKLSDSAVVLMDQYLSCSGPENLAGVLFQRAELDQCVKPSVMTSATKITSTLSSNVLLRCDATGYPTPNLYWSKADGSPVNNTVVHESPGEGVRWSILSLHGIVVSDAGIYRCKAKNVAGNAEAFITLSLAGTDSTTRPPTVPGTRKPEEALRTSSPSPPPTTGTSLPSTSGSTSKPFLTTSSDTLSKTNLDLRSDRDPGPGGGIQRSPPAGDTPAKMQRGKDAKNPVPDRKVVNSYVKDVDVVEETNDAAVVLWTSEGLPSDTPLSVVYFPYNMEENKETMDTEVGLGKLLLENLLPSQLYTVCLLAKGFVSGKGQCVNFSTLDIVTNEGQNKWLIIASAVACAVALPLIALLLYKIVLLYCKGGGGRNAGDDEDLSKETYVKFETLTMKQRTMNGPSNDIWARRQTRESERMLLCSRSSIDSQMTYKSDSSRSEYLC